MTWGEVVRIKSLTSPLTTQLGVENSTARGRITQLRRKGEEILGV